MKAKRGWTVISFITCFLWNAALIAAFFFVAKQVLYGFHQWINPFLETGAGLPEDVRSAFVSLNQFINESERYLAPGIFGAGGLITFFLWLTVMIQGRRLANRVERQLHSTASPAPVPERERRAKPKVQEAAKIEVAPPSPQPAIQMLSILQREGRLIDFLQEDLSQYDDAQIGAAVRNIHQGCKEALNEHIELQPVYEESEGAEITVPAGFDARAVRLTGNVTGDPPFTGVLRHRGWRAVRIELPQPTTEQKKDMIVAPAEVEVG